MKSTTGKPAKPLHRMFTAVPPRYDLINRAITWGMDNRWRKKAARECLAGKPRKVLDLCCGTGDLLAHLSRRAPPEVVLAGLDYSLPMLEIAREKTRKRGNLPSLVYGDVSSLPFGENSLDCIGISFAFRNLTYRNPLTSRYLSEVLNVLRPGGKLVIVETSQPKARPVRWLFQKYLRWFAYRVGLALSGNREAYRYLAESAARFYGPEELRELLLKAGFQEVSYRPLFFGAVAVHVAVK